MWAIRVLTGSGTGQISPLKLGRNLVGRAPNCDVRVQSNGVSKEHAEIHVYKDKILIVDLRSSNGTYLNGIKVQNGIVRLGDKISVHDVILDIIPASEKMMTSSNPGPQIPAPPMSRPTSQIPPAVPYAQAAAQNFQSHQPPPPHQPNLMMTHGPFKGLMLNFEEYMNRVALPGVYKLAEILEFKMVLATFLIIFIFAVTLLSMIPMVSITRSSITQESLRRASSLARNLARVNQQALLQGSYSSLSTHDVETEDGVKRALIVQQSDGVILAPASQAGNSPDLPFVVTARRDTKPQAAQIDSSTIGASFPIGMYDPNTGEPVVKAHAIVLYDVGSLAFDDGRALSLFFQTLVLSTFLGMILFYFMYKLIEYPMLTLNQQIDIAMREKKDNLEVKFMFPALQALIGNLNSLLTRYIHGDSEGSAGDIGAFGNKDSEAGNLLHLIGFPAIAVRSDGSIIGCNSGFEALARNTSDQMANQPFSAIRDNSLRQNMEHLVSRAREVPSSIHTDQLEFSGHLCNLTCQAFCTGETVDYIVVSISPTEGNG